MNWKSFNQGDIFILEIDNVSFIPRLVSFHCLNSIFLVFVSIQTRLCFSSAIRTFHLTLS